MKRRKFFGRQLGLYLLERGNLVGIALLLAVVLMSLGYRQQSLAWERGWQEAALGAAERDDYKTAQAIWTEREEEENTTNILGVESRLMEQIYPELALARMAAEYEDLNNEYPGSRDILLSLFRLERALGQEQRANDYIEQIKAIDPNTEI